MKEWLENQKKDENDILNAVSIQAREVVEDLLPQLRLCALENEMMGSINMQVNFDFKENNTDIWSEGLVQFPPSQSVSTCFRVGDDEEKGQE